MMAGSANANPTLETQLNVLQPHTFLIGMLISYAMLTVVSVLAYKKQTASRYQLNKNSTVHGNI